MADKTYWVYILNCENNSYYTGYTNNLIKRFQAHVNGKSKCKYTRSFKPINVAQCWQTNSKSTALKIENHIKKMSKNDKNKLIQFPNLLTQSFKCKTGLKEFLNN